MIDLLDIICCPKCKERLEQNSKHLQCSFCQIIYPVHNGIFDLIPHNINEQINSRVDAWSNLGYDYDEQIEKTSPERLEAIDTPLLDQCKKGSAVLEIGCGTARLRKAVEKRGGYYVGLDPSLKLLRQGIERGETNLVRGVGEYLPFTDNSFDAIIGGYCSFRYIQFDKLYPECARVLKPGGILAFTLWNNWSLFSHQIMANLRKKKFLTGKFICESCNDVISPAKEIHFLKQYGFTVEPLISTRKTPLPQRLPFVKKIFNWHGYWKGNIGALIGYDIIFICKLKQPYKTGREQ